MKFSILVPVYNVEKYLEQCVDSLLDQTYTGEYEIILVDDGSTDSSGRICDRYAESHPDKIKVIHKENGGLVSARQAGIEVATGEYSLFVDSDDFVENNLLETIFDVSKINEESDIVIFTMSYYNGIIKTPKSNLFRETVSVFWGKNKKEIYEALITTSYVTSLCLKTVKTDLLKADPTDYSQYFDKNMAEDWFRSIHLLTAAKKIVYINAPLYNYRTNEESISRSFRPETIEKKNILYVYDRFMEYLPLWEMDTEEYHQKLDARWLNEVMYTFRQYYEYAETKEDRKAVLDFDWSSMLPESVRCGKYNPLESKVSRKTYTLLLKKKHPELKLRFAYNRFYKNYRNMKSRLLNK